MPVTATPRRVLLLGAAWLVLVWALAHIAARSTPWLTGPTGWSPELASRVTPLARWDSGWYVAIAESGYEDPPTRAGQQTNHAFFPLYPALMRGVARATGLETSRAGALVSAAALLGALVLFARVDAEAIRRGARLACAPRPPRVPDVVLLRRRLHGVAPPASRARGRPRPRDRPRRRGGRRGAPDRADTDLGARPRARARARLVAQEPRARAPRSADPPPRRPRGRVAPGRLRALLPLLPRALRRRAPLREGAAQLVARAEDGLRRAAPHPPGDLARPGDGPRPRQESGANDGGRLPPPVPPPRRAARGAEAVARGALRLPDRRDRLRVRDARERRPVRAAGLPGVRGPRRPRGKARRSSAPSSPSPSRRRPCTSGSTSTGSGSAEARDVTSRRAGSTPPRIRARTCATQPASSSVACGSASARTAAAIATR